ncbi:unnamed protein product, partial [Brassica oleracea]
MDPLVVLLLFFMIVLFKLKVLLQGLTYRLVRRTL